MRVAILGLWHLGSVTAACIAAAGHRVKGWDPDATAVDRLARAEPPVAEPGLPELLSEQLETGRLTFTHHLAEALADAEIAWVTFDTPVDVDDRADVEFVMRNVINVFPHLADDALIVVSSQLPVGSVARLEAEWTAHRGARRVTFAASPENLRLGKAIEAFQQPDRVIVGVRSEEDRRRLTTLFSPVASSIEWMAVESAEMTKHAINTFLAMSVAYINELAGLCEQVGADAKDVERGLKTEARIGPRAYLSPGGAFAGGTLARDVSFLRDLGRAHRRPTPLVDGIQASNSAHRQWAERRLMQELGSLEGRRVAVWGLTYKPGTNTLRRSSAVDLCRTLTERQVRLRVHDPAAEPLPADLAAVERADDAVAAAMSADALIIATEWPHYRAIDVDRLAAAMPAGLVLDANRFLGPLLADDRRFRLISVGRA
ncbi:MAG: nucleotide sugar dehydrogenase [Acidobacteria bacterium]|nr:nucleotide sugar dehydrogenase [Acidobacteriota bacterium]